MGEAMIVAKAIKPARLKDKDMRLTLLGAMRKEGTQIKREFAKTTATWSHKPEFEVVVSLTGPGPVVLVGTDDKVYRCVNEGTQAHLIFAGIYTGKSDKKALSFHSKFRPKTKPGIIGSTSGMIGGKKVARPYVQHPGTKPRGFDRLIQKSYEPKFKRAMEAAMVRAAEKSGHGA